MRYIGIDFSLNSPAACIYDVPTSEYSFLSFSRKPTKWHKDNSEYFITYKMDSRDDGDTYIQEQRSKLNDSINIADLMCTAISFQPTDIVAIEGFAFSSAGNSAIDLAGYQYILRHSICSIVGIHNFYVYSPQTVKKTAGSGRFNKIDMMSQFVNEPVSHKFSELVSNYSSEWSTTEKIPKPIDDLIDSYWIQKTVLNNKIKVA